MPLRLPYCNATDEESNKRKLLLLFEITPVAGLSREGSVIFVFANGGLLLALNARCNVGL
jgi:hypothetical protein